MLDQIAVEKIQAILIENADYRSGMARNEARLADLLGILPGGAREVLGSNNQEFHRQCENTMAATLGVTPDEAREILGTDNAPSETGVRAWLQNVTPLEAFKHFMQARKITEDQMLDYLKEEGRIADFVTSMSDVPEPVIEAIVSQWMDMMEDPK